MLWKHRIYNYSGDDGKEDPPVPIPNTEVKLFYAESTCNYLSSRQLTASTFGVKELNFCVRYGNRWILFAIITAIAISTRLMPCIYTSFRSYFHPFPKALIRTYL